MKFFAVYLISILVLPSCAIYTSRTPYVSTIKKTKEVEGGIGGALRDFYKGAYANGGVGITNFMSVHGSGDYTITGVHLDSKIRFHKAISRVRLNTEIGYGWSYSEPGKSGFSGRWQSGTYQVLFNQSHISYETDNRSYTIGAKIGKLNSKSVWVTGEENKSMDYNIETRLIEPFIHYSVALKNTTYGKKSYLNVSYSNTYLGIMDNPSYLSDRFSEKLGAISVGMQIIF